MFGSARRAVNSNPIARKIARAKRRQRLGGSIERHVDDVSRIPTIAAIRIAERHGQETVRRKERGVAVAPSRPFSLRTVQKQDRRKWTVTGWTVASAHIWQRAANDLERHRWNPRRISKGVGSSQKDGPLFSFHKMEGLEHA